jgi:fatty acyl-CoA reductase
MTTDWVPVDVPINLSIAAAWKIGTQPSTTIPVYNCTSSTINPLTWGQVVTYLVASLRKYPMENALWYPGLSNWEYAWVNWICQVDCWVILALSPTYP